MVMESPTVMLVVVVSLLPLIFLAVVLRVSWVVLRWNHVWKILVWFQSVGVLQDCPRVLAYFQSGLSVFFQSGVSVVSSIDLLSAWSQCVFSILVLLCYLIVLPVVVVVFYKPLSIVPYDFGVVHILFCVVLNSCLGIEILIVMTLCYT